MDFWDRAKDAFQKTYLNGIKRKLIIAGVIGGALLISVILIIVLIVAIFDNQSENSNTYDGYTISPLGTLLDKEDYAECVKNHSDSIEYQNNMVAYIEEFYDICTEYGVSPELAFAHSCLETGYGSSKQVKEKKNYFGMGAFNTNESNATTYETVEDSIRSYCEWVIKNGTPGTPEYQANVARAAELSPYNSLLEGTPDTNVYVLYIRYATLYPTHDRGTTLSQGNPYKWSEILYGQECTHEEGSETTLQEYADYAVYTTKKRMEIVQKIFGSKLKINSTSNSDIVNKASTIFQYISKNHYTYGATSIPAKNHVVDCSAFVDWVLYELGYDEFGGWQKDTNWWYNTFDPETYGWTCFTIGDNDIDVLKPGDIIVLNGTSYNKVTGKTGYRHHMQIFVEKKDNQHAYVYDCGSADNWSVSTPDKGESTFWGYKGAKVIRITNNSNSNLSNE